MNDVQRKIAALQKRGWTLAAISTELGVTPNAVEKWKAGDRSPANRKSTFEHLERLLHQGRIPKQRRYQGARVDRRHSDA